MHVFIKSEGCGFFGREDLIDVGNRSCCLKFSMVSVQTTVGEEPSAAHGQC